MLWRGHTSTTQESSFYLGNVCLWMLHSYSLSLTCLIPVYSIIRWGIIMWWFRLFYPLYSNHSWTTAKAQSHLTKHMSIFNAVFSSSTMMTWAICPKKVALGVDCSSANDWGNDWIPHILPNALKHWIIPQLSQPLPHVDHNYQLMWRPADKRPSTRPGSRLVREVGQLFACWEPMRKICSVCFKSSRPLPYRYWHIDTHRKRRHCIQC